MYQERVTVNLTAKTVQALNRAVALTTDTRTAAINKALQLYVYTLEMQEDGGSVYIRGTGGSDVERIRVL